MIKLIAEAVHKFLFHPDYAKATLRSVIIFLSTGLGIVVASASDATGHVNYDIIKSWDFQAWFIRWAVAAGTGAAVRIIGAPKSAPAAVKDEQ